MVTPSIRRPVAFPPALDAELRRVLPQLDTAPQSIDAADRAQTELLAIYDRHGHAARSFLRVYHGITVAVIEALDAGDLTPRRFFERLAGRFAEKYFDGVKAALGLDTTSDAARHGLWEPSFAFDNTGSTGVGDAVDVPLAHFLVGMSCHINFDLAVALAETIVELGYAGDPLALDEIERGHEFVDAILARQVSASMEALADGLGCPLSRMIVDAQLVPFAGPLAMDVIRRWRARTFPAARRMLAARTAGARRRLRDELYRDGARTTAELFELLPTLVNLLRGPDVDRALPSPLRWLLRMATPRHASAGPRLAARVTRSVLRGVGHASRGADLEKLQTRMVDPALRALAAASRGVQGARVALGLLDVAVKLQRLAA